MNYHLKSLVFTILIMSLVNSLIPHVKACLTNNLQVSLFCGFPMSKINLQTLWCVLRLDPRLRELDPLPKLSLRFCQNNTGYMVTTRILIEVQNQLQSIYFSNIISWNFLSTNHRDSSWFRTYFKLPVHHTQVICLTLCCV